MKSREVILREIKRVCQARVMELFQKGIPDEIRERFEANLSSWRVDLSLKENLENALGLALPKPDDDDLKESDFECGICYMERFGSELPEVVCDRCSKRFHRSCLVDWLRTRRDAEQSFQVVFGACPYCNEQIQCTVSSDI